MPDAIALPIASAADSLPLAAASAAAGAAVAALAALALRVMFDPRVDPAGASTFERDRRAKLRAGSSGYRLLEPLVDALAPWSRSQRTAALGHDLALSVDPLPWEPAEYVALKTLEAILAGLAGAAFGFLLFGDPIGAALAGLAAAWGYRALMIHAVADKARRRLNAFKRRLPYAVDLLALLMESGAGFQEALAVVVRENRGSPLGEEFATVIREVSLGKTRREALESLRRRLEDDEVYELIFAITKGEELGTPLSYVLRAQAGRMLLKHSQWIEKKSAEAQVMIVFPGMIIMVACMLIITAPFLLSALYNR
jgi:tight adherence protein C